ncbi:PA2778 family cysteine peptidase [Polaromonas sp.]|uniref:PA2778 family cysteine peptidase n=1 Tax=Polaromonas sp. TaxID=1869339 RepID=UPI002FC833CF
MKPLLSCLRTPAVAGVFVCVLLGLAGCATPQVAQLSQQWPADLPAVTQIDNVPFFPQEQYHCGPAALAMVAQAAGVRVLPDDLTDQVYLPGRQGSLQVELLAASRRQGLLAYPLAPRMEALLREVAAGNPVLVLQNLAFSFSPLWHYAVVIGFDRSHNTITLHSGVTERLEMSLFTFERTWARGDSWAMVALPPTRLPATAQPDAYAVSAAALERVQPRAAQAAYAAALQAWPQHRAALLGAGNTAYALGQLDRAASAYLAATRQHADFADAWNNLAQVLMEQGKYREAASAIDRAVAIGGVRAERYRNLQTEIRAKL